MSIQLPEPEYYTLAEVAKRWEVSEDVLLRLGAENRVLMGYPLLYEIAYVVRPTQREDRIGFEGLSPEMLRAIGIEPDDIEGADKGYDNIVRFSVGGVAACNWEIGIAIANRRDSFRLNFITGFTLCRASDSATTPAPTLPYAHHYALCREVLTVSFTDLVIPTTEIHRIEHQRETAEKAAANDVLGTKEKETMQAVIAAMTQLIASTTQKYKHGDRPNVDAIAGALEEAIPDRTKRGVSETINKALKAGLIST